MSKPEVVLVLVLGLTSCRRSREQAIDAGMMGKPETVNHDDGGNAHGAELAAPKFMNEPIPAQPDPRLPADRGFENIFGPGETGAYAGSDAGG